MRPACKTCTCRLDLVHSWLTERDLSAVLTHEIPIDRAAEAYQLLDERPDDAVQVVLSYE